MSISHFHLATLDLVQKRLDLGDNLNQMASYILPAVNKPNARDVNTAVKRTAIVSAAGLTRRNRALHDKVEAGELFICSAYFHLVGHNPGKVDWPGDCACPKPRTQGAPLARLQITSVSSVGSPTHTMRWHAHHHTVGIGHLYQGRFKRFPIEEVSGLTGDHPLQFFKTLLLKEKDARAVIAV